ncbi:hypothetical protein MMC22_007277 [Lobaria immixta]|nr:hypothetical protein [Lobaria immixta]
MRIEVSACFVIPSPFLYFFNCKAIFLADPATQSPFLLLAILGCLTWAKLGDSDNNNLAADDSKSAALSPVLVADGGDDLGTAIWRDVEETGSALLRGSQDDKPAPENPTISQPDSNHAAPEDSPGPVPKPDCITVNGEKY